MKNTHTRDRILSLEAKALVGACCAATQSSNEYSCNPPNRFYPQQEPQRFLTEKGEGRRYKETCTLPPTPLLPPYPQTGGYCRCLKPSHLSKPSLPWLGTAQHPPGEVPNPQASSKFIHSTRVARAYHSAWQDFIPVPSEDIKGFSNSAHRR